MSSFNNKSSHWPEIDLLREVMPLLREKVTEFERSISSDFIDFKREKSAQEAVERELTRLQEARTLAESVLSTQTEIEMIEELQEALDSIIEDTHKDVVKYHRAKIIFDKRQDEYNQTNALARHFMTPRTRFARAWEAEEAMSPRSHLIPEANFIAIVLFVFAVLALLNFLYSVAKNSTVEHAIGIMKDTVQNKTAQVVKMVTEALLKYVSAGLTRSFEGASNSTDFIKTEL